MIHTTRSRFGRSLHGQAGARMKSQEEKAASCCLATSGSTLPVGLDCRAQIGLELGTGLGNDT